MSPLFEIGNSKLVLLCSFIIVGGLLITTINTVFTAYRKEYRSIPGPLFARFTQWWRVAFVWPGNAHEDYRLLHEKYGPIVRTGPKVISVSDPSAITEIYSIGSKYLKSDFYRVFGVEFDGEHMDSMFSTRDPDYHRSLKRPVAQKFSMSSMRTLEDVVNPNMDIFTSAMRRKAGTVVNLGAWLQWYAFDVIGSITFDKRFGFMEQERDVEHVIAGLDFGFWYGGIVGQVPWLHGFLFGNRHLLRLRRWLAPEAPDPIDTVNKMTWRSIQEYDRNEDIQGKKERKDFLAFLRQQMARGEEVMSERDLINHLTNNLLAGSDTTGISLRAIFYHLMRNPEVYDRLRREIDEADAAGSLSIHISYEESLRLPYLQACIKEALRMHPAVSYPLERLVPHGGGMVCGYELPVGTIVGVNPAVIQKDKSIFGDDAQIFRPERWIAPDGDSTAVQAIKEMDRCLLVFGAGVRTCIGKNISLLEIGKLVPQVIRQFDLEWAGPAKGWDVSTFWFARQTNVLAKFTPRQAGP